MERTAADLASRGGPPNSYQSRDVAYHLHPATNIKRHERIGPLIITRGSGIRVWDDEGNEYIEGLAGLWSVAVGFGEQRLAAAAMRQMQELPYYHSFGHKSHRAVIDLAEKLVALSPIEKGKAFFTNSGSEANDTVVKLVWYYNNALGRTNKKKFISRRLAYHGITVASGSLTGTPWNHREFDLPLSGFLHVSCPHRDHAPQIADSDEAFADLLAAELEELIHKEGPETIAAFIGEPVMAAGGVYVPPASYWEKIQGVLRKHDILIVADEVITGFGRTGKMFGCENFGIEPDIMVLSKQITSSYMPLAAVVLSDEIYEALGSQSSALGAFAHGFTGSGHPVATAVALENLKIIEERRLVENAARLSPLFQDELAEFRAHPLVREVRGVGLIGATQLAAPFGSAFAAGQFGQHVADRCLAHGLIIRNIGDAIAFCPPLVIDEAGIEEMFDRFRLALDDV
jgi:4-aminobutyrate---pyruvate transaminase